MALFVTSTSSATRHGLYAIERNPPATVRSTGAAQCAIVEQFPWGPDSVVYATEGTRDFIDKFCPGGADRTGAGYMSVIGKAFPILKVVRVLGSAAAKATATVNKTGPASMLTLTAKYKGTLGNSLTWETTAASDGDANHFNLIVTLTSAYGTTIDKFENLNYSGTGSDSVPTFTSCKLIGAITKVASGVPIVATGSFSSGADGSITSARYLGTQGSADLGCALLESDNAIDFVFTGDPGNSLRAAVNAGLKAHADYMTDRMAFINGNSAMSGSDARTDVASYRSLRVCYIDNWAYQNDDVTGAATLVTPAPFAVSVAACLSPSTSFSWKSAAVKRLLTSIVSLETNRGASAYLNELAGICTLQQEPDGGFTFESAVVTYAPTDPSKKKYKRTRMGHYIAKAVVSSLREFTDSPNVAFNQQDEVNAVHDFMDTLKANVKVDPNNLPHVVDFGIRPLADFNAQADLDAGQFTIPLDVKISSDQEKIFLSLSIGESVTVDASI